MHIVKDCARNTTESRMHIVLYTVKECARNATESRMHIGVCKEYNRE